MIALGVIFLLQILYSKYSNRTAKYFYKCLDESIFYMF